MNTKNANDRGFNTSPRHYVKVPAPTGHAGVGEALRQAFHMNGEAQSFTKFEDLLAQLD